jgi:uncharacterized protein (TIGR02271 family)
MPISVDQIQSVVTNGKVVTSAGDRVGAIGQVYLNDHTGDPAWVTVKTGLFGTAESFVPLDEARIDGGDVIVAFDKDTIKHAPRVDADGAITPDEEQNLYRHYGLRSPVRSGDQDDRRDQHSRGDVTPASDSAVAQAAAVGHDAANRARSTDDDDAMTRSEERLRVGTQTHVAGRAVLRKYVTTEYVTQTVPVRREEVRLEREPITDGHRGNLSEGVEVFGDDADVFEVVLHQEVPVVQTETVAVERVRLRKATLTDQATVSEDVRKEELAVDDPTGRSTEPGLTDRESLTDRDRPADR